MSNIAVLRGSLFLLLILPVFSRLYAQDVEPPDDPDLRIVRHAVDSIAGGMPSVGIREMVKSDRRFEGRHAITFDPVLALFYANLSYDRALDKNLTVGGRLILPIPILESDDAENIWGIGGEIRFYPFGEGAKGAYIRLAPTYYGGTFDYRHISNTGTPEAGTANVSLGTLAFDLGWRWMIGGRIPVGLMVGGEFTMGTPSTGDELQFFGTSSPGRDLPFIKPDIKIGSLITLHGGFRIGYVW